MDPAIEYINLDLRIKRSADGKFVVEADSRHGGREEDIAVGDLSTLGARDRGLGEDTAEPPYARDLGIRLYRFLFHTANAARVHDVFERCRGIAEDPTVKDRHRGVRIRLHLAEEDSEIAAIPWEFLFSEARDEFLCSSNRTPVVRFLETSGAVLPPEAWLPLKLLVVIPTAPDLDVDSEKRGIREALEKIVPPVEPVFLDGNVTRKRLEQAFAAENFDFLHFIGHGRFEGGQGALRFNTSPLEPDWITGEQLRETIKNHRSLKLVVLNSCHGAESSTSDAFAGMAPQLVLGGVPAVVAMQYQIKDQEAKTFAHAFYHALFQGSGRGCVDVAITAARAALSRDYQGRRAVGLPVLYIRYHEGVLFRVVTGDGTRATTFSIRSAAKDRAVIREAEEAVKHLGPDQVEVRKEQEGIIARAVARLRYRKRVILTPVTVLLFLILALASGLFERIPLTWVAAASPVWFGDPLASRLPVDSIVIVTTTDSVSPALRPRHAELIDRLSRAGARVVAFDVRFRVPSEFDSLLAAAADSAAARGTLVVGGANQLDGDSLALAPGLVNHIAPGIDCLGQNFLQFNDIVPLLWAPSEQGAMLPAFALSVAAAWRKARVTSDLGRREVTLVDSRSNVIHRIRMTKVTRVIGQHACPIMTPGSRYGEMLAVRAPLEKWQDRTRTLDYAAVLSLPPDRLERFAGGRIVLVGTADPADLFEHRVGLRSTQRYGVERHADAIATILGNAETKPVGRIAEYMIVALLAAFAAFLSSRSAGIPVLRALLIGVGVFAGLVAFSTLLYWSQHRLLNLMYPFLAFTLTLAVLLRLRKRLQV